MRIQSSGDDKGIKILPKKSNNITLRINGGTNTTALTNIREAHSDEKVLNGGNAGLEIGYSRDILEIKTGKRVSFVAGLGIRAGYERQQGKVKIGEHQEWQLFDRTPHYPNEHNPYHDPYFDPYNPYYDPYHSHHHDPHYDPYYHDYEWREVTVDDYKKYNKAQARLVPELTVGAKIALDTYSDYVLDVRALVNANVLALG